MLSLRWSDAGAQGVCSTRGLVPVFEPCPERIQWSHLVSVAVSEYGLPHCGHWAHCRHIHLVAVPVQPFQVGQLPPCRNYFVSPRRGAVYSPATRLPAGVYHPSANFFGVCAYTGHGATSMACNLVCQGCTKQQRPSHAWAIRRPGAHRRTRGAGPRSIAPLAIERRDGS